jgi:hypothetical protein
MDADEGVLNFALWFQDSKSRSSAVFSSGRPDLFVEGKTQLSRAGKVAISRLATRNERLSAVVPAFTEPDIHEPLLRLMLKFFGDDS